MRIAAIGVIFHQAVIFVNFDLVFLIDSLFIIILWAKVTIRRKGILDFPRFRGHPYSQRRGFSNACGLTPPKMAMTSFLIVEELDVVEQVSLRLITGFVDFPSNFLFFQATEERLGNGIIPTVATTAHARRKFAGPAKPFPIRASILGILVRRDNDF